MKITIVTVIYKKGIQECSTFQSLAKTILKKEKNIANIHFIFYDNSPQKQEHEFLKEYSTNVTYIHDQRNLGIATAYNYAYQSAKQNGSEWLLLLDHDTEFTEEYINQILNLTTINKSISAIVPKVRNNQLLISPVYSNSLRPLSLESPVEGIQQKPIMAINSGSLIRVAFLDEVGGFNNDFPLDYLDHWIYYEIYKMGYTVLLLDVELEHDLSVMDYSNVSIQRYRSILDAEINFYRNYKTELFSKYKLQLIKRFIKQLITVKNKQIAYYTLRQIISL